MRQSIYFDHNATSIMGKEVQQAISEVMGWPLNPSSIHLFGKRAKSIVDNARDELKIALNIPDDYSIIFTSGGTEANNLALQGMEGCLSLASTIEHVSILNTADEAAITVDANGKIKVDVLTDLLKAYQGRKILVSVMLANNETGVIQPLENIRAMCEEYGALLHTDASQAVGKIQVDVNKLGADMITVSGHKFGAPLGVGALVFRKNLPIKAIFKGGGQEYRYRPGTHNTIAIHGLSIAAKLIAPRLKKMAHIRKIRAYIESKLQNYCKEVCIFSRGAERLPNTTSIAMPNVDSRTQMIHFDMNKIAISAGSACSSGTTGLPHVHMAMGYGQSISESAIRVSLGPENSFEEADIFIETWKALYNRTHKKAA